MSVDLASIEVRVKTELVDHENPALGQLIFEVTQGDPEFVDKLIRLSHTTEGAWFAFMLVRQGLGKLAVGTVLNRGTLLPLTGYEGYYYGESPSTIIQKLVEQGRRIRTNIDDLAHTHFMRAALHAIGPQAARACLLANLRGERYDLPALQELNAIWGAELGRSRAQRGHDELAYEQFQLNTYALAQTLRPIRFLIQGKTYREMYGLPKIEGLPATLPFTSLSLTPEDEEAYMLLHTGGGLGHPIVRSIVSVSGNLPDAGIY